MAGDLEAQHEALFSRENGNQAMVRIKAAIVQESVELNLSELQLTSADLEALIPEIKKIKQLKELNLKGNDLQEIPQNIGDLSMLKALSVEGNQLQTLPEAIGKLINLEELELSENKISELPASMEALTKLDYLNLRNNGLKSIPEVVTKMTGLSQLGMAENELTTIPNAIGNLTKLTQLSFGANQIKELPEDFEKLTQLKLLDMGKNILTAFPNCFCKLVSLEHLNCAENIILSVPQDIGAMVALQKLSLRGNIVVKIPNSIGNLQKLQGLDLENNWLREIPESICDLQGLKRLILAGNSLDCIPDRIGDLFGLTELDFRDIKDLALPVTITNLIPELDLKIDLRDLPKQTADMLIHNFEVFSKAREQAVKEAYPCRHVLELLYPEIAAKNFWESLQLLGLEDLLVYDENGAAKSYIAEEVMLEFLKKIPLYNSFAEAVYIPAAKSLLDLLKDPGVEPQKKQEILQKIATALGACETPVKQFLSQVFVGNCQKSKTGILPKEAEDLLTALALEHEIRQKFRTELRGFEAAEHTTGFLHSVFLRCASNLAYNPIKIKSTYDLPPFSRYVKFGLGLISSDQQVQEFAQMCCQTNGEGQLIQQEGQFVLDSKKMKAIKESYLARLGLPSERERAIQNYGEILQEELTSSGLNALYTIPDVLEMLQINKQQNRLRLDLQQVPDSQIQETKKTALDRDLAKIEKLVTTYHRELSYVALTLPISSSLGTIPRLPSERGKSVQPALRRSRSL